MSGVARHVCVSCGAPQPLPSTENYFELMEVPQAFSQELASLEKKFYEISRALHPDRFAASSDSNWKALSLERMSAVNRAYQVLSKKESLRDYILELEGVKTSEGEKPSIPAELAEEWFDLQDSVMEEPDSALSKLDAFESDLKCRSAELQDKILRLESEYDGMAAKEEHDRKADRVDVLAKIQKLVLDRQYLKSMHRDLARLKSRLGVL